MPIAFPPLTCTCHLRRVVPAGIWIPNLPTVEQASVVQMLDSAIHQARVVQTLDSATHRINHYPVDKYLGNQWRFLVDRDLSSG